jgi:hypothetical protein
MRQYYMLIIRYIVTLFSIQNLAVRSGRSAKVTATARVLMNIIAITLLLDYSLSHKLRQAIRASRLTNEKEIKKQLNLLKRM